MCTLKKREGNSELFLKSQGISLYLNSNCYLWSQRFKIGNGAIEKNRTNWVSLLEEDTYGAKGAIVSGD